MGLRKFSDPSGPAKSLLEVIGNGTEYHSLNIGKGEIASIALKQALEFCNSSDEKTIISVTGGSNSTNDETVNLIREHFTGELWVTERSVESELVRVTLLVV